MIDVGGQDRQIPLKGSGCDPHVGPSDLLSGFPQRGIQARRAHDFIITWNQEIEAVQELIQLIACDAPESGSTDKFEKHGQRQARGDEFGTQVGEALWVLAETPEIDQNRRVRQS
jgi:hypothetical protein